jgi:hypothetical protein
MPLTIDELKKLPYLDLSALDGRTVQLMPLWGGTSWRMWVDTEVGLIEGKIVDALESDYLAKQPAKETDLFIPFVHLIWNKQAILPLICRYSTTICTQ